MLERLFALEASGIKLGLENITRLCAALGHPERQFTSLHVAGTNGKGSVTAMAHTGLVAAGVRAARYTSPHLVDLRERFVIGDAPVDAAALEQAANDVLDCAERLHADGTLSVSPTFFEATTAIAFELFRRAGVQVAVIEVGLGGRFDSTNILNPPVGAITSIGLDHQQYLGDTIAAIAFEKAGIIKPGMTVITGALPDEARQVIEAVAGDRGARVVDAAAGTRVEGDVQDGRATLVIDTPEDRYGPLTLGLRGEHQRGNALVAVRMLEAARATGIWLPGDAIERGLSGVQWPARLELITRADGRQVLLDAAHNLDGARALAEYLARWHADRPALVIGVMRDKDVEGMIDVLLPVVSSVTATAAATPRAIPADELAARVRARRADVHADPDPVHAVEDALARHDTVCVAGSIFLAGDVRDVLKQRAILR
ncbi:MAG: bifunctional folylpolyglutamate synthase/dihydrofolate synthase [Acidimicrobiia bacterium]|nr:bifunctional folylpolyglutamate synthase/dihydrofolate synthase [Acidimicrobiia bacterium]